MRRMLWTILGLSIFAWLPADAFAQALPTITSQTAEDGSQQWSVPLHNLIVIKQYGIFASHAVNDDQFFYPRDYCVWLVTYRDGYAVGTTEPSAARARLVFDLFLLCRRYSAKFTKSLGCRSLKTPLRFEQFMTLASGAIA